MEPSAAPILTDAHLARLSRDGNRRAFELLAQRWSGRLHRFIRRMVGSDEEARDLCQETLLRAYQRIGRLRRPEGFRAWLHQIALNLCRDRARAVRARPELIGVDDLHQLPAPPALRREDPLARAERADLGRLLEELLAALPPEQRSAILLREFQGLNSREIGGLTGVAAATVRSRIYYGLKTLRGALQKRGIAPEHPGGGGEPA